MNKDGRKKYCEEHPYWQGGRIIDGHGYVQVLLKPDDPFISMANHKRYILEHRLLMARHLGRCLSNDELVHHLNGDIRDNRIDNLEVHNRSSHALYHIMQLTDAERLERASMMLDGRNLPQG